MSGPLEMVDPNGATLEAPGVEPKPKGLVPRATFFWVLGLLMVFLIAYAIYDISRDRPKKAAVTQKADDLGPAPALDSLQKNIEAQKDNAEVPPSPASAPMSDSLAIGPSVGSRVADRPGPLPSGVPPTQGAESRVNIPSSRGDDLSKEDTAEAQLQAQISRSRMIAINGPDEQGQPAIPNGVPVPTGQSDSPPGNGMEDVIKALASARATAGAPGHPSTGDVAWLKDNERTAPPDVAYASSPPGGHVVTQGTRLPVVLLEAMNSDLPGRVTARTTEAIRDSATQSTVLIPAGTRLHGQYSSEVKPGQSRMLVAFTRMVLPDGRSVNIGGAQGSDAVGQAGIDGDVNHHWMKMYGYSFAIAIIGEKGLPDGGVRSSGGSINGQALTSTTRTVAGEVLADVSKRVLDRYSYIPPTITTPVGERMFVHLTKDIVLQPWGVTR